jgi:acyl-CoA synthetase (AMP-forming)/AMP-acid ligase II
VTSCAIGDGQKTLIVPGIAGGFGFNRACELLFAGKTACFAVSSEDALWLIGTFGIDSVVASPQQALALAEIREKKTGYSVSSLKTLRIGGAAIPPQMGRKLRSHLCRNIILSYASTEAGTAASAPYDVIESIPDAVGIVAPDVELEIVDEAGAGLPAGSEGFIRLRTPQLSRNRDPGEPATAASPDPWFYPGDIGRLTPDRILCVTGRSSDVINSGGVKVSATKIEEIVQALPEIQEAAACGVMSPAGLEEVWIAVVAKAPLDVADIKRRLQEHPEVKLAPGEVFVVDRLPRGDLGKVQKYRLKEQLLNLKKGS